MMQKRGRVGSLAVRGVSCTQSPRVSCKPVTVHTSTYDILRYAHGVRTGGWFIYRLSQSRLPGPGAALPHWPGRSWESLDVYIMFMMGKVYMGN